MRHAGALLALSLLIVAPAVARAPGSGEQDYYQSRDGSLVHRPTQGDNPTFGRIMATCRDGSASYSHHHQGTCSGHGGVQTWRSE